MDYVSIGQAAVATGVSVADIRRALEEGPSTGNEIRTAEMESGAVLVALDDVREVFSAFGVEPEADAEVAAIIDNPDTPEVETPAPKKRGRPRKQR